MVLSRAESRIGLFRIIGEENSFVSTSAGQFPYAETLGFRVVHLAPGEAVVEGEVDESHHNPAGRLHGGYLCSIADTAMGMAHWASLTEGIGSTTVEMKINFLRPFFGGRLRATARMVKSGRTLSLLESEVMDAENKLVAWASSTYMALHPDNGDGGARKE
jgi:acyl-CoA thioesterase